MMCAMGAARVEVISALKDRALDANEYDYIILKDEKADVALEKGSFGDFTIEQIRSVTWFKQCLILGSVIP